MCAFLDQAPAIDHKDAVGIDRLKSPESMTQLKNPRVTASKKCAFVGAPPATVCSNWSWSELFALSDTNG
jgi:hypothetical protein